MKLRFPSSAFYLIGLLSSLITALAISAISRMPSRHVFSALLGILTFLICCVIIENKHGNLTPKGKLSFKFNPDTSREVFVSSIYAASLVLVVLIPPANGMQFTDWTCIPATNYMRLFAGILLSSMLPRYGLLRLIDRNKRYVGLDSIVFSFFISVFLMSLMPYILMVLNIPVVYNYWASMIFNIAIFFLSSYSILKNSKRQSSKERTEVLSHQKFDYLILSCLLLFFVAGWFVYYSSFKLGSPGDMWNHYAEYVPLTKDVKIFSSPHLAYLSCESWFALHYIAVSQLTGFPTLNGWMVYAFINFFYILAFYQMVRDVVGDRHPKVPAIATIIATLFAGFGWVKALSLASGTTWGTALDKAGGMTYNDMIFSFVYGPIPQYFSLAIMSSLLYLMVRKGSFDRSGVFLTVVLVAQGYLVHIPEIALFPVFYYCFLLFVGHEEFGRLKKYSFSILLGLFTVFIVGLPFSTHFYFDIELPLMILFVLVGLTFVLMQLRTKIGLSFRFPRRLSILIIFFVWVLYGLSFLAWDSTLDLNITGNLVAVGLKPWYVYPVSQGASLLLGLLGLSYIILRRKVELANYKFHVSALILFFVLSKVLSYVNVNIMATGYWEKRFGSFMIIPLSIFGALFLSEVLLKLSLRNLTTSIRPSAKYAIAGLLISLVVISGVSSLVLALDRISLISEKDSYSNCSEAEMKALDFLRTNASAYATILGFSTQSNRFAYVFSGMNHLQSPYMFTKDAFQFIDIANPELALKMLYSLNITYLYVTQKDREALHSSGFVATHLLNHLPIAFQNNEVTIYQIPRLYPPSSTADFTVVVPSYMLDAAADPNILAQRLPRQMLFNETFGDYAEGSNGTPIWNPLKGTWKIANGLYSGTENTWAGSPSIISSLVLSDFSIQTHFRIESGYYAGIVFRYVDFSNFYMVVVSSDGKYNDVYKKVDGTTYLVEHSTGPPLRTGWNTLQVMAVGKHFSIYLNGDLAISTSDPEFASGKLGLLVDCSTTSFDNVTVEQPPDVIKSLALTFFLPIDMMAQSGLQYSIRTTEDGSLFDSGNILLPSDQWSNEKIRDYLAWVEKGGRLIVLDSDGLGNFAQMLSIYSNSDKLLSANRLVGQSEAVELEALAVPSLFSNDGQVKVIANYTSENNQSVPLVLAKKIGVGEVFYGNVRPFFEALYSANDAGQANFPRLGNFVRLLNLDAPSFKEIASDARWKYVGYDTTWVRDYVWLEGSVRMQSDSIVFPYDQFRVGRLELVNVTGTASGSSIQETIVQEIDIRDFAIKGAAFSVANSDGLYLFPTNYGAYSGLLLRPGFNISMQLANDAACSFMIGSGNDTYGVDLNSGVIIMENITTSVSKISDSFANARTPKDVTIGNKLFMVARTPFVSAEGSTLISEAYIPSHINYVPGFQVQVNGMTQFNFDCSSENVAMLTDFGYSGVLHTEQKAAQPSMFYWELAAIPWGYILTSPFFAILCILLVIVMIIAYGTISNQRTQESTAEAEGLGVEPDFHW